MKLHVYITGMSFTWYFLLFRIFDHTTLTSIYFWSVLYLIG